MNSVSERFSMPSMASSSSSIPRKNRPSDLRGSNSLGSESAASPLRALLSFSLPILSMASKRRAISDASTLF
jgi:hypothetical protein